MNLKSLHSKSLFLVILCFAEVFDIVGTDKYIVFQQYKITFYEEVLLKKKSEIMGLYIN